jgi:hypothetical protein
MVEKKEKSARGQEPPKSNADSNDVRTEARRKAKEDGRDWQSLSKEERKAYKKEARERLGERSPAARGTMGKAT